VKKLAAACLLIGFVAALMLPSTEPLATAGIVLVHLGLCIKWGSARWKKTGIHAIPDPLTVYFLFEAATRAVDLVSLLLLMFFPESLIVATLSGAIRPVSLESIWKGQLLFLLSTLIISGVWRILFRERVFSIEPEGRTNEFIVLFIVTGVGFITLDQLGVNVGYLTTVLKGICLGCVFVVSAGKSEYSVRGRRYWVTLLATLPLIALGLRTGMKSEVLIVLLPLLIPYFRQASRTRAAVVAVALLVLTIFLVSFASEWRTANWATAGGHENIGISDVATRAYQRVPEGGLVDSSLFELGALISRMSSLAPAGLVVQYADKSGFIGGVLLENAPSILVPRFLWPDKPTYSPGGWFYWYMGLADSPEKATTAVAMHLPSEFYFMFGIAGTLLGVASVAMLAGLSYAILLRCQKQSFVAASALWPFALLIGGISGMHSIYALSGPLIFAIYCTGFFLLNKWISPFYKWISPAKSMRGRVG
jgi:hypothetical protein